MTAIPRVAIIELLVHEYKVHLFRDLNQVEDLQLLVCHSGRGDQDGPPAYDGEMPFPNVKVRVISIPLSRGKSLHYQCLLKDLERYRPDVVIMQDGVRILSNVVVHSWCKRRGIPVAFYTHGWDHQGSGRSSAYRAVVEGIRQKTLRRADATIAYSELVADALIRCGIPREKVFTSPNTLDVKRVAEDVARVSKSELENVRSRHGLRNNRLVLYAGRLVEGKRPQILVHAAKIAAGNGKPFDVIIAGEGPLRAELELLIAGFSRSPVRLVGHLASGDLAPFLKLADLVCVPGMTGLVIVHALAAGRPYVTCVSDDHGPEIAYMRDGENGRMVSPATAEALATALSGLMDEPLVLERMGRAAQAFALSACDPIKQRAGFVEAITAVVAGRSDRMVVDGER
jgi:glycosyltransferase involved in cell wall biosynthesis